LSIAVDYCFNHTATLSSGSLLTGAIFYSFQIYCDFSGYSDIGIGAAKVMGIRLMENFDRPYGAHTIAEFWSRWHISLSTWFRDYVYIPLGGSRRGEKRRKGNVLLVFLLSGLWHGANWTFVIWGGLHGLLTAFSPREGRGRRGVMRGEGAGAESTRRVVVRPNWVMVLVNFWVVTLCWVFFRAPSVREALRYLGGIFRLRGGAFSVGLNGVEVGLSVILIGVMLLRENSYRGVFVKSPRLFAGYFALMLLVCYFLGVFSENQFIYFQF
jgi:alginate O-acetyltransferase complex protein AlgI